MLSMEVERKLAAKDRRRERVGDEGGGFVESIEAERNGRLDWSSADDSRR